MSAKKSKDGHQVFLGKDDEEEECGSNELSGNEMVAVLTVVKDALLFWTLLIQMTRGTLILILMVLEEPWP